MEIENNTGSGEVIPLIDKAKLKDPLLIENVQLNTDFYALSWLTLRKDVFEDLPEFRGHRIFPTDNDFFWLKANFLFFISVIIITVSMMFIEVFTNDLYHDATWQILILRVTLVAFAQRKLEPEFYQAIVMLRYTSKHSDNFGGHVCFAYFISFCQIFIATITFFCIILFVCMANTAVDLIKDFAALAVISELDDWIGTVILTDKPHGEDDKHKNKAYALEGLNEKMKLSDKMSFLDDYLEIVDDRNGLELGCITTAFTWFIDYFPWVLLPLITIPINDLLLYIQPHVSVVQKIISS